MLQKADKTDDFFLPSLSKEGGAIDFERDSLENRTVFLLFFHRPFRWAVSVIYLDCRLFNRLKSWLDDVIGLEGGNHDVGDPQADEEARGEGLDGLGPAQLSAHRRVTAKQEGHDGDQGLATEQGHGEAQAGRI